MWSVRRRPSSDFSYRLIKVSFPPHHLNSFSIELQLFISSKITKLINHTQNDSLAFKKSKFQRENLLQKTKLMKTFPHTKIKINCSTSQITNFLFSLPKEKKMKTNWPTFTQFVCGIEINVYDGIHQGQHSFCCPSSFYSGEKVSLDEATPTVCFVKFLCCS